MRAHRASSSNPACRSVRAMRSAHRPPSRICADTSPDTRARAMQPIARARRYSCQHKRRSDARHRCNSRTRRFAHTHRCTLTTNDVSRRRSRAIRIDECTHVRNSFTRVAKLSVSLYTCLRSPTNCRDAPTRRCKTMRKAQLTSCIYVANLMQLRRCEWRYVACAPPRSRFRDNSRINNPEGERV
jgi:hypothetical protein